MAMTITGIYDALNDKAESFSEWAQAHPKFGLLFVAALLACPVAHGVVVPLEMGVPVAILGQIMVFR